MLAYHNDPRIKTEILAQLAAHAAADEIVKGQYWQNGKGCAVGCTIYSSRHVEYETRFGIPQILARLEDRIFEGLPNGAAKEWPQKFMAAIKPGVDLSSVWPKFAVWLLTDAEHGVIRFAKTEEGRAAIQTVSNLYAKGERDAAVWRAAQDNAWKQRNADAADAAYADAYAYAYAYAADADADAADAYACAAYAAYACADAAYAYAAYAYAYADADAAYADAKGLAFKAQSEKLLELLTTA